LNYFIMRYTFSFIAIIVGMFMVIKSEWILKNFGYNEWAENKFSAWGGSRTFYKFFGIALIILALMIITGWAQDIFLAIFAPTMKLGQ
jgi:hypothetical protein